MIFSSHKFLTITFLLLISICGFKNAHAEFSLTELSLSGLTFNEKYKRIKERLQVVKKRIKFIKNTFADWTLSQIRVPKTEYHKLIQEQRDLISESDNLNSKLRALVEEQKDLISRAHRARAYEAGEYEKKLVKAQEHLRSQGLYALGLDKEGYLEEEEINEILKIYPQFIFMCKIHENMLYTDVGPLLRKDFGWKKENFSWVNDAIKFIDQEFIEGMKEVMVLDGSKHENFSDFEKDVMNSMRDEIIRNPSDVEKIPSMCKAVKKLHDIMLPNRRKNIINRIGSHIEEWLHQR